MPVAVACLSGIFDEHARHRTAHHPENILFIAVDDLNDWVGALGGHPQAVTPNMDKLAQRGLLFTNAHCTAPGCNASRTSLLMGLRPSTTGIYQNAHDWRNTSLVDSAVHLPKHFKNSGYETLGAGKLFHAHTFFDPKYLTGFSDSTAWDDYFPSLTQQMPAEAMPEKMACQQQQEILRGNTLIGPRCKSRHRKWLTQKSLHGPSNN